MNKGIDVLWRSALEYLANTNLQISLWFLIINAALLVFLLVFFVIQAVKYRADYIARFRWGIVGFITVFLLTLVPVGYYLTYRFLGIENADLRNFATINSRFGPLALTVALTIVVIMIIIDNRKGNK